MAGLELGGATKPLPQPKPNTKCLGVLHQRHHTYLVFARGRATSAEFRAFIQTDPRSRGFSTPDYWR